VNWARPGRLARIPPGRQGDGGGRDRSKQQHVSGHEEARGKGPSPAAGIGARQPRGDLDRKARAAAARPGRPVEATRLSEIAGWWKRRIGALGGLRRCHRLWSFAEGRWHRRTNQTTSRATAHLMKSDSTNQGQQLQVGGTATTRMIVAVGTVSKPGAGVRSEPMMVRIAASAGACPR